LLENNYNIVDLLILFIKNDERQVYFITEIMLLNIQINLLFSVKSWWECRSQSLAKACFQNELKYIEISLISMEGLSEYLNFWLSNVQIGYW